MKTFKEYLTEVTRPAPDNWKHLLRTNKMLSSGVRLLREIEKLGGEAYIVGGSVRDILLGKPIKDVDIATSVPLTLIKQHFKWNDIGQSGDFGITMVHYGGFEYEVANFREEAGTSDNRRPDRVSMVSSFEADSARRDITINSMGINSKGEIVDYQNGIQDLERGIIRAVGNPRKRFEEDALRILRVARFASKYGFDIDDETKNAMKELGHLVDNISRERVHDELMKISIDGKYLAKYIEHLDSTGQLERILPEVSALKDKKQNPLHHPEGDAFEHTMAALVNSRSKNPITNLAILLHDLGKGTVEAGHKEGQPTYHGHDKESSRLVAEIGQRLKFPRKVTDAIMFAAANHMKAHYINDMSKKKITQLVNSPYWDILKDVVWADEMSRGDIGKGGQDEFEEKMRNAEQIAYELSQGAGEEGLRARLKDKIDGFKVMQWTGLRQGAEMGSILKQTQDWLYGNMDATDKEVKDYVMNLYDQLRAKTPTLESIYSDMWDQELFLEKL